MYTPGTPSTLYMSSTEIFFTSNGVFFISFLALRTFGAAKQVCNQLNITCFDPELYDSGTQPHLNTRSSNWSQVTRVDETEHQSELIVMARAQSGQI